MPTVHDSDRALARLNLQRVPPAVLYDNWFLAETEAELALVAWRDARRGLKAHAHAVYTAALEREEHAAELLAARLRPARA